MYKSFLSLIFVLFLGLSALIGQTEPAPAYLIHLDKSFYVNGEVMWYKLLLPNEVTHRSAAIKVVLTDRRGRTLFYTFLKNKTDHFIAGYYKIPFDLPTDMYRLSFLASDISTGQNQVLAYVNLPIYNDSEILDATKLNMTPATNSRTEIAGELNVQIDLSADTLRSRDQMEVIIKVTDANGSPVDAHLSLAVSDQELAVMSGTSMATLIPGLPASLSQSLDTSITIKGDLTDYFDQALTANVLGVLAPEQNRILYTRTLSPGKINLQLPDFYDRQPFQFLGFSQEEDSIQVRLQTDEKLAAVGEVNYTPEILAYLDGSRKRKKIFQLYTDLEFNLQTEPPVIAPQEWKPERTINVKNYEAFDNAYLFFKEILTPLVFRKSGNDQLEAKIFTDRGNSTYEMLKGSPLFIIDGQATRDGNYVAHMKMEMVETVQLFTDRSELRRQFNVMGSSGVVIIKTSSADIVVPEQDADDIKMINGLQVPVRFPAFSPDQLNGDRNRPFFRPQLYWEPDLKTDAGGEAKTSFYQSDARGNFQLRVLVQDKRGRIGYAEKTYYAAW